MRRTLTTLALVTLLVGLMAPAVLAQEEEELYPPHYTGDTPCTTFTVVGNDWGSDTTVIIEYPEGRDPDCPDRAPVEGTMPDEDADEDEDAEAAAAGVRTAGVATTDANGTFSVDVLVPSAGSVELVAVGTGADGTEERRAFVAQVADAGSPAAGGSAVVSAGGDAVAAGDTAAGGSSAPGTVQGEPAIAFFTLGNSMLLALLLIGAAVLFWVGPLRRRQHDS